MAKPLLKHGKFELHKLGEADILPFYMNLSKENVREYEVLYDEEPYTSLLGLLNLDMVHSVKIDGSVAAVTGVYNNVFWAMFSKDITKNWRGLVRGSPKLVEFYHNFFDELECNIWAENVFTLNWVAHLGFEPRVTYSDEGGNQHVHFVRCKHWFDDVHSKISRPVMH